ncbi:hypothetical protein Y032_0020g30 [Ancylostoma ceylanicum]|uniref:Uncharacterized protein n=1 Tax=Ancylostoma ceylanicum TaxID=53326 RepID=A0A016V362_9BILA|nr:hypothetical protein Y032_0020g30 [Ancylostoma ceylanicum]
MISDDFVHFFTISIPFPYMCGKQNKKKKEMFQLSATKLSNTRTPFKGAGRNQNADDKKKPNGTPMKRDSEQESEIDIFLALGGVIAAVFVFALVVILIVIILASKKKKTPKKPKKSKNIKDKAPPPTSDERTSERSTRWSQEAVRTSPSVEYNKLTYGMPGYSDNIGLSRHTLPDRALGIREDQEGYVLRSDAEIKRMKRQQARELRRVEQEFLSLSERDSDYDLEDGQRRRRDDSI